MSPISILHAPRDEALGAKIAAALAYAGHAATRVSADQGDMAPAEVAQKEGAAIVVWTHAAAKLARLHRQAEEAMERGALIPVAVGGASPPGGFENLPPVDLSGWTGAADDPRWRFVLEEIQLTAKRMGLEDADLWASAEIEPHNDEPGLNAGEDLWTPGADLLSPQVSAGPDGARKAEPLTEPPTFLQRPKPKRRFSAREVAIGATAGLVGMTVLTALLAPVVLSGAAPEGRMAAAPRAGDKEIPDPSTKTPSTLASVTIDNGDIPSTEVIVPPAPEDIATDIASEEMAQQDGVIDVLLASHETETNVPLASRDVESDAQAVGAPQRDAMGTLIASLSAEEAETQDVPEASLETANTGAYFTDCEGCPGMAAIPAGSYKMGAPAGEVGAKPAERPQREIDFAKGFAIAAHEVTYDQWDACVADGACAAYAAPDHGWGRGARPVVSVSYEDALGFIAWLSGKTGKAYRLPTEAEWEYAARGGSAGPFSFGSTVRGGQANYNGAYPYSGEKETFRARTVAAGSFAPNAYGLYDMHGNAWEWTADCWAETHAGAPSDGSAVVTGDCSKRVLKGGAWNTGGWRLRSAHRIGKSAKAREFDNGFRVARDL